MWTFKKLSSGVAQPIRWKRLRTVKSFGTILSLDITIIVMLNLGSVVIPMVDDYHEVYQELVDIPVGSHQNRHHRGSNHFCRDFGIFDFR